MAKNISALEGIANWRCWSWGLVGHGISGRNHQRAVYHETTSRTGQCVKDCRTVATRRDKTHRRIQLPGRVSVSRETSCRSAKTQTWMRTESGDPPADVETIRVQCLTRSQRNAATANVIL